ncbi:mitotic-spindle organizing gamma-tubulin ring associated-domain-containing protein [Echria macrotheca]|uniref:Mitotic-spindle organizing protein 1 n=1 Tax=Echria macrotheca TaxID=438768 RepID=A0AAJ0BQJ8_9PEZI|nr:mitotic-spindle organizing gamma-tubulin ring associated-domain-containing protein [Echria macrotheca]
MPAADDRSEKQAAAQQAVDILHEISTILNCHLDRRTLSICISMIENGVNPEALASVVKELRREGQEAQLETVAAASAGNATLGTSTGAGRKR